MLAPYRQRWKGLSGCLGKVAIPRARLPCPRNCDKLFGPIPNTALNCLLDCLTCEDHAVRLRAAEAILTRGFGRGEAVIPEDQETPPEDRAAVQYNWSLLSNDEWKELTTLKASLKILLAKAEVPVGVEGEG